jgi:Holliday junction resolvase RusA-like endonuclease
MMINEPVNIRAIYYMKTRRRVDKTNLESALLDMLVHYEVLADDNCLIVAGTDGSRVKHDPVNPRTEVIIERIKENI